MAYRFASFLLKGTMSDPSPQVFIGGLHRSGTTPLARVLSAHPEISGLSDTTASEDEGQHLQDVYPRIRKYGGMGRFANAPDAHLTETSPLASPESARRLIQSWSPYWDCNRRLLLEKSPANMIMGRFLQALFPGSCLIVVVRHPIAVSLAMQKWNPAVVARNGRRRVTLDGLVRHWLRAHELLRQDARALQRLHVVRYEDLVADPITSLRPIEKMLDLSAPLDISGLTRGRGDVYQARWERLRRSAIRHPVAASIAAKYGDAVAEYGYDIDRVADVSTAMELHELFGR